MEKNIYILPTKNTGSNLLLFNNSLEYLPNADYREDLKTANFIPQHIYIISNDEPKLDEWGINITNEILFKGSGFASGEYSKRCFRKIILTTDPLLIKSGVQEIPSDFLEWFADNKKCEFAEITQTNFYSKKDFIDGKNTIAYSYNIHIPEKGNPNVFYGNNKLSPIEWVEQMYSLASYNLMSYNIKISDDFLPNLFKQGKEMEQNHAVNFEIEALKRQIDELRHVNAMVYTEEDMLKASKYGYDFHKTTQFPKHDFEDSCINNTKQWLTIFKK
jgi:hypothetical protein